MSWVPLVSDEQASPEVKRIYDYIRQRWSFVPNYFRALGHDAQLLQDQTDLYTNAMFDDRGLPRLVKEQLAIVVSGLNVSTYCLPAHLEILGRLGMDKAIGRKLALDYPSAPVEPKVMELFRFADKLTRNPGEMEKPMWTACGRPVGAKQPFSTRCSSRRFTRAPTASPQASASSQTFSSCTRRTSSPYQKRSTNRDACVLHPSKTGHLLSIR